MKITNLLKQIFSSAQSTQLS